MSIKIARDIKVLIEPGTLAVVAGIDGEPKSSDLFEVVRNGVLPIGIEVRDTTHVLDDLLDAITEADYNSTREEGIEEFVTIPADIWDKILELKDNV